ncbi:MAG: hypothetical protein RL681_636 [Candidatus Parcubacteria bacterium]|jgi:hypothetical protein
MLGLLPAPRAVFFKLYLPLYFLLVLAGIKIPALADVAPQNDKIVGTLYFRHNAWLS